MSFAELGELYERGRHPRACGRWTASYGRMLALRWLRGRVARNLVAKLAKSRAFLWRQELRLDGDERDRHQPHSRRSVARRQKLFLSRRASGRRPSTPAGGDLGLRAARKPAYVRNIHDEVRECRRSVHGPAMWKTRRGL